MRIEQGYYGDFKVMDELPFDLFALIKVQQKIWGDYGVTVSTWPVSTDLNETTGYWEVWFTRPVTDQEYVENMLPLPDHL